MAAEAQRAPSVRERTSIAAAWRRFITAVEPWYNWGETYVERMQELRVADGGRIETGGEGPVRYFEVQWLGVHFAIHIGRTPKAVR